ncbi:hypothetical protein PG988_015785 [Apiospora saccharicola]
MSASAADIKAQKDKLVQELASTVKKQDEEEQEKLHLQARLAAIEKTISIRNELINGLKKAIGEKREGLGTSDTLSSSSKRKREDSPEQAVAKKNQSGPVVTRHPYSHWGAENTEVLTELARLVQDLPTMRDRPFSVMIGETTEVANALNADNMPGAMAVAAYQNQGGDGQGIGLPLPLPLRSKQQSQDYPRELGNKKKTGGQSASIQPSKSNNHNPMTLGMLKQIPPGTTHRVWQPMVQQSGGPAHPELRDAERVRFHQRLLHLQSGALTGRV